MATASPPPAVKPDEKQPPLPPSSSPPLPPYETASPPSSAEHAGDHNAAADQSSGCLAVAADVVRVTTDGADSSHAPEIRIGVDSERSPSTRLLQTPDDRREPPSGCSALSSGQRQRHRRRRKHTPTAESEKKVGRRRQAFPNSPVDDRVIVLPRPDSEYEAALRRLTEAASHAAELYREITEASSASLASRGTGAGGTGEGSVVGMECFPPMTSSSALGGGSHGLSGAGSGRAQAGIGRAEGKHGSTSSSGAGFSLALSEIPSDSAVDDAAESGGADEYEDDDEWETEEEEEADGTDRDSSPAARRGEERRKTGTSNPLSLEKSFRESFASVNGVLSAIAGRTAEGTFVDSSRVGAGTDGTSGSGDLAVGSRGLRPSSSSTGEAVGAEVTRANSLPASPDPSSLPPTTPLRQAKQPRETASGGDGLPDVAFRLSTVGGVAGEMGGRAGQEEQMPAEMSGMLQRYSEMMLKVVQEKMEARMADGTLRPS